MRSLIRSAALTLALLPAIAWAQVPQFPQQLPANSVVGRLGVGPGPSQAIPMSTLFLNAGFVILPVTPGTLACFSGTTGKIQSCPNTVVWNGVALNLAAGGTNNGALAASAGGIVWSDASKLNILAGTASANLCLLSGSNAAPTWGSCAGGSTVNSIAGNTGAFTLNGASGLTNTVNDIKCSQASSSQFGCIEVDNVSIKATAGVISATQGSATLQAQPGNPSGTTSATGVMMGFGTGCHITPVYSSRVRAEFIGGVANSATNNGLAIKLFFGTGTAPANAAAITGTQVGSTLATNQNGAANISAFAQGGIITGLTPGTAYWLDISLSASAGTSSVTAVSCNAMEF